MRRCSRCVRHSSAADISTCLVDTGQRPTVTGSLLRTHKASCSAALRALVQPLCAILGAFVSARTNAGEGTTPGRAAAARLVTPTRTAECLLACLQAIFEQHGVADPSQARCGASGVSHELSPAELVTARFSAQVLGVAQLLVLVLGIPHDVRSRCAFGDSALLAERGNRSQASSEELQLGALGALAALVDSSCIDELRAEANAPLLGHALSLLLQVADAEASAGDRGSRTLRAEAFRTLELLLRQARPRIELALAARTASLTAALLA